MASDDLGPPSGPANSLEHVRWSAHPRLHRPVLITAFEGWNDAGDAASTAVRHLSEQWGAEPFASIDPELFFDFSSTRPQVRLDDQGHREILWPENILSSATISDDLQVIILVGTEPQLRWRTFCSQITTLAHLLGVRQVMTVGALLSEVPHTRPTPVYGAAYDDELTNEMSLMPSSYEGPTGIVGVLHAAFAESEIPSASLWAAVPTYVPSAPSPKAALALVERATQMLHIDVDVDDLAAETNVYEEQISELVDADDESRDYVTQLESTYDDGNVLEGESFRLVQEVERFLRDNPE